MNKIFGIIYKITNKINGKIYIGQTIKLLRVRWSSHCNSSSCCRALYIDIKRYGKENFVIEEVIKCDSLEKMNKLEIFYIKDLNTLYPFGYNLTSGGKNYSASEESRLKRANTWADKSEEEKSIIKDKISKSEKGKIVTADTKFRISVATKKALSDPKVLFNLSESHKGINNYAHVSEEKLIEWKYNLSKATKGENHPNVKLSKEQVTLIRELPLTKNYLQKDLASMFNVSKGNISAIITRRSWAE